MSYGKIVRTDIGSFNRGCMGLALVAMGCVDLIPRREGGSVRFIRTDSGVPGDFRSREEVAKAWNEYGQGKRNAEELPKLSARARR